MNALTRGWLSAAVATTLLAAAGVARAQEAPTCATYSTLSATGATAGSTNGTYDLAPGDTVTITVTLGTATAATFSIVGESTGTPVYVGPANAPGTLAYTVPAMLPGPGVGWYVNTANGTVNVAASCLPANVAAAPVPTLTEWGRLGLVALVLAAGATVLRRRRGGRG